MYVTRERGEDICKNGIYIYHYDTFSSYHKTYEYSKYEFNFLSIIIYRRIESQELYHDLKNKKI